MVASVIWIYFAIRCVRISVLCCSPETTLYSRMRMIRSFPLGAAAAVDNSGTAVIGYSRLCSLVFKVSQTITLCWIVQLYMIDRSWLNLLSMCYCDKLMFKNLPVLICKILCLCFGLLVDSQWKILLWSPPFTSLRKQLREVSFAILHARKTMPTFLVPLESAPLPLRPEKQR